MKLTLLLWVLLMVLFTLTAPNTWPRLLLVIPTVWVFMKWWTDRRLFP